MTSRFSASRRRRLLWRSGRRGSREMDLLLGGFASREIDRLSDDELDEIEAWTELPDPILRLWLEDPSSVPEERDTPLLRRLRVYSP